MSLLNNMRGDKKGWYKVSDLRPGVEIAVPSQTGEEIWDEIVSITPVGREQVYDIEVEGTNNFVGNGIFAHNTYVLRANTMLAVEGVVHAGEFDVPLPDVASASATTTAEIPFSVLTADGKGVDLYKLSTYNLATTTALAARMDAADVRVTSLESRVDKLESGAVSSATGSPLTLGTESLASAFESLGAYISKGFAQFGTLIADQFVAATNSAGTSSAGSISIPSGNTEVLVSNAYVKPSSKIFITFTSSTTGAWYVSDKRDGSFKVVLEQAPATDVTFDYFIVQTEGQLATSTPAVQPPASSSQIDTEAPVITLLGDNPVRLSIGGTFVEPGVTVTDNVDSAVPYTTFVNGIEVPDPAAVIDTGSEATYIITYSATDQKGNLATVTRAVIIGGGGLVASSGTPDSSTPDSSPQSDTTPPVVTLVGEAAMEIIVGDAFTDPGATATDPSTELGASGTDLTASIVVTGAVDVATEGLYTLTYTTTDAAGNVGSVSRVVTVIATPAP